MDYEKKYKEALNKAQRLSIDGFLDAIAISDIFPELKESEDDRIRKTIIRFFKDNYPNETDWKRMGLRYSLTLKTLFIMKVMTRELKQLILRG